MPEDSSSSEAEDINVDEVGRLAIGGQVDLSTRCLEGALHADASATAALLADCAAAFTARVKGAADELSSGSTFWVGSNAKPATTLERLALEIFRYHSQHAQFEVARSGAEWWTQVIDSEDDIGLHWDRDYDLQADQGINLHPYISTVTYLSAPSGGAPTLVLARPSPLLAADSAAGPVPEAHVCSPAEGRHLCFDGKLLHGALAELAGEGGAASRGGKRVTLLVNVWLNHTPWGAEPLPKSAAKRLKAPSSVRIDLEGARAVSAHWLDAPAAGAPAGAAPRRWEFGEKGTELELSLPWPHEAAAALHAHHGFLRVGFATGSGAALAAAPEAKAERPKKSAAKAPAKPKAKAVAATKHAEPAKPAKPAKRGRSAEAGAEASIRGSGSQQRRGRNAGR